MIFFQFGIKTEKRKRNLTRRCLTRMQQRVFITPVGLCVLVLIPFDILKLLSLVLEQAKVDLVGMQTAVWTALTLRRNGLLVCLKQNRSSGAGSLVTSNWCLLRQSHHKARDGRGGSSVVSIRTKLAISCNVRADCADQYLREGPQPPTCGRLPPASQELVDFTSSLRLRCDP